MEISKNIGLKRIRKKDFLNDISEEFFSNFQQVFSSLFQNVKVRKGLLKKEKEYVSEEVISDIKLECKGRGKRKENLNDNVQENEVCNVIELYKSKINKRKFVIR